MAVIGLDSAGKLRSVSKWTSTNESGLDILPSGYRSGSSGVFEQREMTAFWWDYQDYSGLRQIFYLDSESNSLLVSYTSTLQDGYSVRCVRD